MQTRYSLTLAVALAGMISDSSRLEGVSITNDAPRAAQVSTVTVDTAENSSEYTITIDGIDASYTSDATATVGEIAAGLAAAVNAEALLSGRMSATAASAVCTITALIGGRGFTLTEADARLTAATSTANATADPVNFGVAVIRDSDTTGRELKAANLTAMSYTVTPAAVNDATYWVGVHLGDTSYTALYTADASATVKEIVEGLVAVLEAQLPASTVSATEDDAAITLTAEVAGMPFSVSAGSDAATATMTVAKVSDSALCDVDRAFAGVTIRELNHEMDSDGETQYAGGETMSVAARGRLYVEVQDAVTTASRVHVRVAGTGAPFAGAAAANYLPMSPSRARFLKGSEAGGLAVLEIR